MSEQIPLVSVIMPVYNTAAYVGQAIQSVLDQTFEDWELIIIDDGSSDGSEDVVRRFSDSRIRFERHSPNRGVSRTLNRALELSRGTWVARHDSDDVSLPERLNLQVAYLRAHPECGILGTYATTTDPDGRPTGAIEHHPTTDAGIRFACFFDSPFVSSTVIFRRALLEKAGGFDEDPGRPVWDDYDMWSRLVRASGSANLPLPLLKYRMLPTGLTGTTGHARDMVREQRRRNIAAVLPEAGARAIDLVARTGRDHARCSPTEFVQAARLLHRLIDHCRPSPVERKAMEQEAHERAMSLHVLPRRTLLGKLLDRAFKWTLLSTTAMRP